MFFFCSFSVGLYLFKAYTNGHAYDTSDVWMALVQPLLRGEQIESEGTEVHGDVS